jgi:hypothetical protein
VINRKGRLEHEIPSDAEGHLGHQRLQTPINDQLLSIQIGHLDPVEKSLARARLNNLGYFQASGKEDEGSSDPRGGFSGSMGHRLWM